MINAVGSTPPVAGTTPPPTGVTPPPTGATPPTGGSSSSTSSVSNFAGNGMIAKIKKNWKIVAGVVFLLVVLIGAGAGYYLVQQQQDLRQQAKVTEGTGGACPYSGGDLCNPGETKCRADGVSLTCNYYGPECIPNGVWKVGGTACDQQNGTGGGVTGGTGTIANCWTLDNNCSTSTRVDVGGGKCSDNGLYNDQNACQIAAAPKLNCYNLDANCTLKTFPQINGSPATCTAAGNFTNSYSSCQTQLGSITCTSGETKCADSQIITCDNGQWSTSLSTNCPAGCYQAGNAAYCYTDTTDQRVCYIRNDNNKCIGGNASECNATATSKKFDTYTDCTNSITTTTGTGGTTTGGSTTTTTNMCPFTSDTAVKYTKFVCPEGCKLYPTTNGGDRWQCFGYNGSTYVRTDYTELTSDVYLADGECGQVDVFSGSDDASFCGWIQDTCQNPACQNTTTPATEQPAISTSTETTTTYACNTACTLDTQCQTANVNYVCDETSNKCRLSTNLTSATCQATATPTPSPTPTPTPAPGCNEACTANADCTGFNHICYQSQYCRLSTNPTDTNCQPAPTATPVTQLGQLDQQPETPTVLPNSGAEDLGKWFSAGLGAMVIGAIFLLLL